jgi:hypothetical protein
MKLKSFYTTKEMVSKLKRLPTKGKKIFARYLSDKGLINGIYSKLPSNQRPNEEMSKQTKQSLFKGRSPNGYKSHEQMLNIPGYKGNTQPCLDSTSLLLENTNINKYWQGCGEKETLIYSWWECELVQPLWKRVKKLLKN